MSNIVPPRTAALAAAGMSITSAAGFGVGVLCATADTPTGLLGVLGASVTAAFSVGTYFGAMCLRPHVGPWTARRPDPGPGPGPQVVIVRPELPAAGNPSYRSVVTRMDTDQLPPVTSLPSLPATTGRPTDATDLTDPAVHQCLQALSNVPEGSQAWWALVERAQALQRPYKHSQAR